MTAIEFIMQFIKGGSATDVSTSGTDQLPTGVHDSSGARIDPATSGDVQAVLDALPPDWSETFRYSTPDSANLPSGAAVTIHPVLNTESNVIDSGWLRTGTDGGVEKINQLLTVLADQSLSVYVMNASSDSGDNLQGNDAPTLVTVANAPGVIGANFFARYFRIVAVNTSGSTTTSIGLRSTGGQSSPSPVVLSLDQPVFGFYPAPITRAVTLGANPDGDYGNIPRQGIHSGNTTTTPLNANGVYRGEWRQWMDNDVTLVSSAESDVPGTLYIDFTDETSPTNGDDSSVVDSLALPFDPAVDPFARRITPVQSRWVRHRYINGNAGQSYFRLNAGMLIDPSSLVMAPLENVPVGKNLAGIVRSVTAITDGNGGFQEVPVDTNGTPTVSVESINDDVLLRPLPSWDVSQRTVTASPVLLDAVKLSGRRAVQVKNHDTTNNVWIGPDNTLTQSNGELIPPLQSSGMILSETGDVYAIGPAGSTTAEYRRDGTTATGTAASPSNALTSDDTRAVYSAVSQTVEIDGYTAGTTNAINLIHLCVEGRKASTPATQTVAWLGVTTGTGNTGTATASSVPAGTNVLYVADVSIEATNSVTMVSGGSMTWTKENSSSIGSAVRTSRWWAYGSPGAAFNVSASLNAAGNHNIAVNRYSGAHSTTPFENTEISTANSSGYSDAINGTALGIVAVAVAFGDKPHTVGSGATERSQTSIGSGGNAVSLATTTEAITVTGSQTYAGTFSGAGDWAVLASCIVPAPSLDPTLTLSYELSGVPGASSGVITFTSTTDATFETVDITGDEAWAYTDVPNITVIGTATTVPVNIEIDRLYLLIEDSSGTTVRVSIKEMA